MLNNKAQTLVIFVLLLPIIILFLVYVLDVVNINYEKMKLDNISNMIVEEIKKDEDLDICLLVEKNDSDIECEVNEEIVLKKRIKSLFGNFTKKEFYEIEKRVKK